MPDSAYFIGIFMERYLFIGTRIKDHTSQSLQSDLDVHFSQKSI